MLRLNPLRQHQAITKTALRTFATAASTPATPAAAPKAAAAPVTSPARNHKIVVIGGGSAGTAISHQLLRRGGFKENDIAIVDPSEWHHYQPGWTLVGGGLKDKQDLRLPMKSIFDPKLKFYNTGAATFTPEQNALTLTDGRQLAYEHLVVAPGISLDFGSVKNLGDALEDRHSLVSTIYDYRYCDKASRSIANFSAGHAIFTQPAGVVKCAGAPQKIMWLATDAWKQAGTFTPEAGAGKSAITVDFATGLPAMFGVPKYSAALEEIRKARGVQGLFQHDLVAIEEDGQTAVFTQANNPEPVKKKFDFLHVAPKNKPHAFLSSSPLANPAGYVDVDDFTTQHKKFPNVWSAGDASSLPTSKTVAAITSQAPVLVSNILRSQQGYEPEARYDGYTSCPLLTEYGKVMLAEFKYGGVPKETFGEMFGIDQAVPRRAFYHLKKDFFPWVYKTAHLKGNWGGPKGWTD